MFSTSRSEWSAGPLYHSTTGSEDLEESSIALSDVGHGRLPVSAIGCYRVLVFSRDRCGIIHRDLRRIRRKLKPLKLKPLYLHPGGELDAEEDAGALFTFYVNSYRVASALFRIYRVNRRLWLRVNNRMPLFHYDAAHRRALKEALLTRYDPRQRSLDLTLFHQDGLLQGSFCPGQSTLHELGARDLGERDAGGKEPSAGPKSPEPPPTLLACGASVAAAALHLSGEQRAG